jgi:hypothetical protein
MIYFALLFLEIIILFLISRSMSKTLSGFMSINLLSFILLPGVIVHELAHFFMALILFVPVRDMEFVPKKINNTIKLGSVEVAKTDPIRRSIIGFAPVFLGVLIAVGAVYLFISNLAFFQNENPIIFIMAILVLVYLLFAVSNTMFSSAKDMEGAVEILLTLLVILCAAYLLGFRLPSVFFEKIFTKDFFEIIQESVLFLLAPITIDVILLGAIKLFTDRLGSQI